MSNLPHLHAGTHRTVPLKDLATLHSGGTPSRSNSEYWGGQYPWITAKDLKSSMLSSSLDTLTKTGFSKAKVAPKNSILILVRGMTLFKDVPVGLATREMAFNQDIKAIIPTQDVEPRYLLYYLVSRRDALLKYVESAGHGTGRMNIDFLKEFPIFLPDINEQKAIANLLSTWDEAIEKTERLIQAEERRFLWLVTRLLDNSPIGQTRDKYIFGDIFSPFKEVNKSNEDLEVISVTKDGIVSQSEYFNKEVASEDKSKYLIARRGSLVMSGLNFWMGSIDFQDIRDIGIVSPAYKTFKINNSGHFDQRYLRFFVRSKYMRRILMGASVQGASVVRRNLDKDLLVNSVIYLPPMQKQQEIAELFGAAEKEIILLKKLADQYRTQKRGLMQKLLTGQWRVKLDKEVT